MYIDSLSGLTQWSNLAQLYSHEIIKLCQILKIDIEGHELTGLPDWVVSGILKNVNQLALELHLQKMHEGPK